MNTESEQKKSPVDDVSRAPNSVSTTPPLPDGVESTPDVPAPLTPTGEQYVMMDPAKLQPHPFNTKIYGVEALDEDFVKNVQERGIYAPLIVTTAGKIISGHRRYAAAVALGPEIVPQVPAIVRAFADELAEREALLDHNRQRDKSNLQKTREYLARKDVESQRAKLRMATNTGDGVKDFAQAETGKARDKAAEPLGKTGATMEKGEKVVACIDSLRKKKKDKKADELEKALNQSFDAGLKKAKEMGLIKTPRGAKKGDTKSNDEKVSETPDQNGPAAGTAEIAETGEDLSAAPAEQEVEKSAFAIAREHAVELLKYIRDTPAKKLSKEERDHWDGVLGPLVKWFNTLRA